MVCLLREKNQLEQVQICSKLEIILTFSRKCLFYRIFTLPIFTLVAVIRYNISQTIFSRVILHFTDFLTRVCMMHVFMMRHICHACTNLNYDAYVKVAVNLKQLAILDEISQ